MNLSRPYSDTAPQPKSYMGIGFVVALHVAGIYALSAGLIRPLNLPKEALIPVPPIVDKKSESEPLQNPLRASKPLTIHVPIVEVPTPPAWEEAALVNAEPLTKGFPPNVSTGSGTAGTGATVATTTPTTEPKVRTAGAVCAVMPQPEPPAVNWSGEAVLQVLATVRGGRVVGSDVRVMQGALDGKTRRSLQRSVEAALAGYQCQGDAMFQQDFAFRLD